MGLRDGAKDVEDTPGTSLSTSGKSKASGASPRAFDFRGSICLKGVRGRGLQTRSPCAGPAAEAQSPFEITACYGVIGLERIELRKILCFGDANGFHDLPGIPVGAADVANLSLGDKGIESARVSSTGVTESAPWI